MDAVRNYKILDRLRARLEEWRKVNHAPTPIPPEIWAKAAELAAELGVSAVSRDLRLGHGRLKKRMDQDRALIATRHRRLGRRSGPGRPRLGEQGVNGRHVDAASQASFVELLTPLAGHLSDCSFEVESPAGRRLRVAVKNLPPLGLAAVLKEFVR